MLVLTRRPGEQIVIGNGIRLTVVSIGPGRVKLGIEAPPDVRIDRQEIHDKILQEKAAEPLILPAVSVETPADVSGPIVVNGTTDLPKIHNRVADKLPGEATAVAVSRLVRNRLPRKSR
jgi:carbon storage regulator